MAEEDPAAAEAKVRFLITHSKPRDVLGHGPNLSSFARVLGVARETLRDAMTRGSLDSGLQSNLAKKLDFQLDWPEWRIGTAADFEARYLRAHEIRRLPIVGTPTRAHIDVPQRVDIIGLIALEMITAQIHGGEASLGFLLSCGNAVVFGVPITIKLGQISWDCGGARLDPASRKERGTTYEVGTVKLEWNGGDAFRPAWRVEAAGRSIGNLEIEPNFARVIEIVPDSEITFTFGVWASDLEDATDEMNSMATDQVVVGDNSSLQYTADTLPLVKRRILVKLAASALEKKDGFIVLAMNKATFIKD